jgi:hypothetical protein
MQWFCSELLTAGIARRDFFGKLLYLSYTPSGKTLVKQKLILSLYYSRLCGRIILTDGVRKTFAAPDASIYYILDYTLV